MGSGFDYCLWLNGKKVYDASDIKENFDLQSLRGYFIGGSLINWLKNHSGEDIVKYLNDIEISDTENIDKYLEYAFGIKEKRTSDNHVELNKEFQNINEVNYGGNGSYLFPQSFNAFIFSNGFHSYLLNQNFVNSFEFSSKWSYFSITGLGIYSLNSGNIGSYNINSFDYYGSLDTNGSFTKNEILSNIADCPLNGYGYGIHLI